MTQLKHWKWLRNQLLKQERDLQDKLTLVRDNRRRIEAKLPGSAEWISRWPTTGEVEYGKGVPEPQEGGAHG